MSDTWSLGTLVGLPIGLLLTALGVAVAVYARKRYLAEPDDYSSDRFEWKTGFVISAVVGLLAAGSTSIGMYPYSAEYHQWRVTSGQVDHISKRLVSSGDGMSEKIVVEFTDGRERGCNDTRCSLVESGDHLTLTCKRAWQFAGVDGYDCNFVGRDVR